MRAWCLVVIAVTTVAAQGPSPRKIAFNRVFPNAGQIGLFIAAADGSGERPLLETADIDYDPCGRQMAHRSSSRPNVTGRPICFA